MHAVSINDRQYAELMQECDNSANEALTHDYLRLRLGSARLLHEDAMKALELPVSIANVERLAAAGGTIEQLDLMIVRLLRRLPTQAQLEEGVHEYIRLRADAELSHQDALVMSCP